MSNINSLIKNFSIENLNNFLRKEIPSFKTDNEELDYLFQDDIYQKYESIIKIGEAIIDNDELIIIASKTNEPLTERTGKKNQYEIAKTILKHEIKDASLFVFYDNQRNFRFSFVKANYLGTKRNFTDFKRYSYFVTPNQTNQTFIKQIGNCNFNSIDEIINAFSVEPLNKQFYQEISKSFYKLIGGKVKIGSKNVEFQTSLKLPATPIETNRKTYQEFAVRLIGRTIFCWFLKSKKSENSVPLIPESWLSSKIVNQTDEQEQNYYHSVLEKLFFLVLNKKQNDRKNYELPKEQELIPFLNGGLFEAQLDDFFPTNNKGIHQIAFDLKIPNQWFIELFEILEQYNFTIDENSIYDAEVSIDPEMLGTIFENLLAEIDPDTEKSARKATGSFYTPREIVDYMVEQSLVQYLKTKVLNQKEENLLEIFKEGGTNKFDKNTTEKILKALSEVKILDPACGSGAFPMGALHKIINALQKLDPNATWWKNKQIANVPNAIAKKMLKEKLDGENADYIRKLGIIQNSIYGVDIQPIASEISKLRSFLSLVIDETIIDEKENRGIQPLPNLEFKFVTANTLIGLDENKSSKMGEINSGVFDFGETNELQDELKNIRNQYLQAYGKDKKQLRKDFDTVQTKIIKKEIVNGGQNKKAQQLASWKPFGNESNSWFDPNWMFGVDKFDIVIGNPPYYTVQTLGAKSEFIKYIMSRYSEIWMDKSDILFYFLKQGIDFTKTNGCLSFIISNAFLFSDKAKKLRNFILKNAPIKKIINFEKYTVFESAMITTAITFLQKSNSPMTTKALVIDDNNSKSLSNVLFDNTFFNVELEKDNVFALVPPFINKLNKKIDSNKIKLGDLLHIGKGMETASNKIFSNTGINENNFPKNYIKKRLTGTSIDKYYLNKELFENIIYFEDVEEFKDLPKSIQDYLEDNKEQLEERATVKNEGRIWWKYSRPLHKNYYNLNKIWTSYRGAENCFAFDDSNSFIGLTNTTVIFNTNPKEIDLKYLLALLNSKLLNFRYKSIGKHTGSGIYEYFENGISKIPIPKISDKRQKPFIDKVKKILKLKKGNKKSNNLEKEIDIMVYHLYKLDYQEVKIIDPEFNLSEEEYKNYKL